MVLFSGMPQRLRNLIVQINKFLRMDGAENVST